jgi:gamma-glutamyltranspeptidase/glutathione hydrolase
MVATVHPLATEAGVDAFRQGGNAIDAAVAAALTLGVVDNHNSGIGGGCFILARLADGRLVAIDGRETAPAAATRDMFVRDGKAQGELSQTGPLAVGVPGALAAHALALEQFGTKKLADLLSPAADLAQRGFRLDRTYARSLQETAESLARFDGSRSVLLKPDGSAYREGELLRQPDLANTYRAIAKRGPKWFYQGPFARRVGRWMARQGGILTAADFASYRAKLRRPIVSQYRGLTVVGFPPPSSGGIHGAQILNILEHFDLGALDRDERSTRIHIMAEAMKRALADRAYWLGDSDFARVPRGLIDRAYAARLAQYIDPRRATRVARHGLPPNWPSDVFGHTTHIAAADGRGIWVGITATVNTAFGSKLIVPGTGVILNNEMDDFSAQPGAPNAFGLVGAENNAIAPGKRPLSSMSPTIVLDGDEPILTLGSAGGAKIITQVVQTVVNYVDLKMPIEEAVAASRVHHQWLPDRLMVEKSLPAELIETLRQRGHAIEILDRSGVTQAIARSPDGKQLIGVHDPRVPGLAKGL